jgi:hypothetical protein
MKEEKLQEETLNEDIAKEIKGIRDEAKSLSLDDPRNQKNVDKQEGNNKSDNNNSGGKEIFSLWMEAHRLEQQAKVFDSVKTKYQKRAADELRVLAKDQKEEVMRAFFSKELDKKEALLNSLLIFCDEMRDALAEKGLLKDFSRENIKKFFIDAKYLFEDLELEPTLKKDRSKMVTCEEARNDLLELSEIIKETIRKYKKKESNILIQSPIFIAVHEKKDKKIIPLTYETETPTIKNKSK